MAMVTPKHFKDLVERVEKLESVCSQLDEEHAALCDCLQAHGVFRPVQLLQRQRVRRVMKMVTEVFQAPELCLAIGHAGGLFAARQIESVSHSMHEGMREALPTLSAWLMPRIYVCGGRRDGTCLATVERIDLNTGHWEVVPPMPTARYGCAAASADGCLYVFGGHGGGPLLDSAEKFDPARRRWEVLPSMPTPRIGCTVATMRGMFYVIGGFDGRQPLACAERFNPQNVKGTPSSTASVWPPWEILPEMPTARYDCSCEVLAGFLYVFGGQNHGGRSLAMTERYGMSSDSWVQLARMPTARTSCATVAVGGMLHVFGGFDGRSALRSHERFDPSTGKWSSMDKMPFCCYEFASASVGGSLYIFGGHDGHKALNTSWRYSVGAGCWERLPNMPAARSGCTGSALGM